MFLQQRKGLVHIPPGNEVHWYNCFHNLYCELLGLPSEADPEAETHLDDGLVQRFLSEAPLSVNACTVLRKIATEWSDQFGAALQQLGVSAWETADAIASAELTADRTETLDSSLFRPVNCLLAKKAEEQLDLWTLIDYSEDCYRLDRYREKIQGWVTNHFFGSSTRVFLAIPGGTDSQLYIGTINELFFWVFAHDPCLNAEQPCTFETDNHMTLVLPHLTSIDFCTWPEQTCYALLTQAMEQTDNAEDIAKLFSHQASCELLKFLNLLHTGCYGGCRINLKNKNRETPLHFAASSGHTSCVEVLLSRVGITVNARSLDRCTPLHDAAKNGHIDCVNLLLNRLDIKVDVKNYYHWTPLNLAAANGHTEVVEKLLTCPRLQVNSKNRKGFTPLHSAADGGHDDCVRLLLERADIDVNSITPGRGTALILSVYNKHIACAKL